MRVGQKISRTHARGWDLLLGRGRCRLQRLARILIAPVASLAETRLGKAFIFRRCDSLFVHDANVEAPRPIARIAGVFENLPGLDDVLGNSFPEKITFPELSAAPRKSGRTALLEEGC